VIAISMPAALRVDDMYTAIIRMTNHDVIAISIPYIAISMPSALRVDDMNTAIIRMTNHDVIAVSMPGDLRVASRLV
jgi:hypothetical protein